MKKILTKIFPIVDYLYIYQLFEYNSLSFLKWTLKYPLKRNLQRKHQIEWTKKTLAIFILGLMLMIADSVNISLLITNRAFWTPLFFILIQPIAPVYLIIARLMFIPFDIYLKNKILTATEEKLRKLPKLKIVGITGSFGKTSTKEILYCLLKKKFRTVKTPKSFNTPLGVASTVLDLVKGNTEIFIAEIGAYKKGEIKNIADLIKPEIGIITAIAPQHLERFGSLENIAHAKFELVESLPKNGLAILNAESEWLKKLAPKALCKVIFYGADEKTVFVTDIKSTDDSSIFTLNYKKQKAEITLPLVGEHHIKNFLAAATAAINLGLSLKEIKERAKWILPTSHRLEIKKQGNLVLIENSYNTNPESSKASLDLLNSFELRKIIITPGFVELGKEEPVANQKFGEDIACIADEIIIVGENAKQDLLLGIKNVWPDGKETTRFVNSTKEGLILASQLAKDFNERSARNDKTVVLLENDLPDQYF